MPTPDSGDTVLQGQQRVGMLSNVDHGEVVVNEGVGQAGEGEGDQQGECRSRRAGDSHPAHAPVVGAEQRQGAENQGDQGGKD